MALTEEKISKLFQKVRPKASEKVISKILDFVKEKESPLNLCVDVGCGTGLSTFKLSDFLPDTVQVEGLDISEFQVAEANRQLKLSGKTNVSFRAHDCNIDLPYKDGEVDLLVCVQSAHWLKPEPFLKECDRVLRPGGVLVIAGYSLCHPDLPGASPELNKKMDLLLDELQTSLEKAGCWPTRQELLEQFGDIKLPYSDIVEMRHDADLRSYQETTLGDFFGYVETWSALRNLRLQNPDSNLFPEFKQKFIAVLPQTYQSELAAINIIYPWFLLMGRKPQ